MRLVFAGCQLADTASHLIAPDGSATRAFIKATASSLTFNLGLFILGPLDFSLDEFFVLSLVSVAASGILRACCHKFCSTMPDGRLTMTAIRMCHRLCS